VWLVESTTNTQLTPLLLFVEFVTTKKGTLFFMNPIMYCQLSRFVDLKKNAV